jgi:hypothetical protein
MECGFTGKVLRLGIKVLEEDWEARQIFMTLEEYEAKTFILAYVDGYSQMMLCGCWMITMERL